LLATAGAIVGEVPRSRTSNPGPTIGKRSSFDEKAFNLLRRADRQRADDLRLSPDVAAPFDTNLAEAV
jgi:hypothetical protein